MNLQSSTATEFSGKPAPHMRIVWLGLALWVTGTVLVRLTGQHILRVNHLTNTMLVYLISFMAMALIMRRICQRFELPPQSWASAATLLMLPTLLLDPFSCAFFATIFPNLDPRLAGIFGGWMLIFCAGAVVGVWI